MKEISAAGNTVVLALLTLEELGFRVVIERCGNEDSFRATRGEECYVAQDPVTVLGLITLVENRSWGWMASDAQNDQVLGRYGMG